MQRSRPHHRFTDQESLVWRLGLHVSNKLPRSSLWEMLHLLVPFQVSPPHWTFCFHLTWQPALWPQSPKLLVSFQIRNANLVFWQIHFQGGKGGATICSIDMVKILPSQPISSTPCDVTEHGTGERWAQLALQKEWAAAYHSLSPLFHLHSNSQWTNPTFGPYWMPVMHSAL